MPRPDSPTATWNPDAGAGSHGEPLLPPGRLFADRYEVRELLGTGGSAQVFRAWDRTLRREVALKVLMPERAGANARRRLAREAALARDVESPHLLRVFDVGEAEGLAFLILELLPGGSLRDRLRSGPLPVGEAVEIGRQLLTGLAALHAARIVHRDVKPSNVLFTAAGEAKLGDLGVALPLDADETRATSMGALLGTIDYLSPEQALGHEADERSDLFAIGLVLCEMLTGDLPFVRDGSAATLLARLRQPAPAVRHRCPEAPRWLDTLVARLLEADPRCRPQSAEAVLADLRARRFRLPSHRRRRLLAAVAAAGALLAAAGFIWQRERAGFSHLAVLGEGTDPGVVAVDRAGRELWRLPEVAATVARNATLAHLVPGELPRLVAILHRNHDNRPESTLRLTALDPATGAVVDRIDLRAGRFDTPFPGYAMRYVPNPIVASDLDRDGIDELLISYHHVRSWPAFTILYEPRYRRSRVVYRSAGHERFAAAHDLDGDGHPELLFTGINSLLGSYPVATAVRLFPPVAEAEALGKNSWVAPSVPAPGSAAFRCRGCSGSASCRGG
ncbi:MAG TPA: serine/threonine-protein kinase [Thermoanaerobaculia bacterium]|nr:serine/threonine-protein kinase [Thermoanaerobaculia bacterium]